MMIVGVLDPTTMETSINVVMTTSITVVMTMTSIRITRVDTRATTMEVEVVVECFKCKNMGHYANECPEKKVEGPNKPNPFQKGQVNHINVEEIYEESDAV